jgi:UDP-N-acetylmuramyl tripeptide synthase
VLDVIGAPVDDELIAAWRSRVEQVGARLSWANRRTVARRHAGGVSLALTAPVDQLFLATEVNEWALCASLIERDAARWSTLEAALVAQASEAAADGSNPASAIQPVVGETAAFLRFDRLAHRESNPALPALLDAAAAHGLPHALDESELTLGAGAGGRSFALTDLPQLAQIPWGELWDIPTAIVTGSNGKTTTVRLLAACARAHGWHTGYNCTDGVFLDDEALAAGDYSGPVGARMVLRESRSQAAIIETARGGILRRGIAVSRAQVAVITNVSSDHFGEYGIDDLTGLAQVKLTVATVVKPAGLLVLNADDALLRAQTVGLIERFGHSPPIAWFSASPDQRVLNECRLRGQSTCGVNDGRLALSYAGAEHDLGPIAAMPLSVGGSATYNIANMAGATLAASALGIRPATIAAVLAQFGGSPHDNPGRMMRFDVGGATVLIDYAHNPDGLRGFLKVANHLRSEAGRLALLLGHAGNRKDEDIEELARAAAEFQPDLVVVKENEAHLRGRALGEVPRILRAALRRLGFPDSAVRDADGEIEAAQYALQWARPGDVLALPLHAAAARNAVVAILENR